MKKEVLWKMLDEIAPLSLQEEWDNSGVQVDVGKAELHRVLVCLDVTDGVIGEAVEEGCDLIVSHHPLLFHSIKRIRADEGTGRYLVRLIENGISVYSSHTPFDTVEEGNNDYLSQLIGLHHMERLRTGGAVEQGMGRIGVFEKPLRLSEVAQLLSERLGHPAGIKVSGDPGRLIRKVGVCTGGAGEFYEAAAAGGCDLYITGDVRHHEALGAKETDLCLIDAGHFGTEWIFVRNFAEQLRRKAGTDLEVFESKVGDNPFDFVV